MTNNTSVSARINSDQRQGGAVSTAGPQQVVTNGLAADADIVDRREALFNSGEVGKVSAIQVSTERVVQLQGIMYDLDPHLLRTGSILPTVPLDPHEFYATVVQPMLARHDVLDRAEVRNSGTGLHVILRFDKPVVINSDAERDRWIGIIQVVQCVLPIDTNQPHITAVTRPVGSINSKNGATVSVLKAGTPVTVVDVIDLFDEMTAAPFKTVMKIIAGAEKIEPCPVCHQEGSRLSGLSYVGQCYASCGEVKLEQLYDLVFVPRPLNQEGGAGDDASGK